MAVGSLQLHHVACDALVDPLKTPLHLGLGEVLIARIDSLEFGTIDGNARLAQQIKLAAQRHEGTADLTNRLAVVLAEIRNGLEVRRQLPRQPDQLDVALAFALKAAARRNAIEIAINVYLEQGRRMIARPPLFQRLNPTKAKLAKIKTFNESVNRTNQIVLGHVVVKRIARYVAQLETADRRGDAVPEAKVVRLRDKIVKLREEVARLSAIKAEMMKSEDKQISLTDPDARSMATSGKDTGIVGYNVQAAVDTKNHLIVAHE